MEGQHSTGDSPESSRGIILQTPEPPSDLSYADFEDFRQEALLKVNGIPLTEEALLSVLDDKQSVLQSSAAHTLGVRGSSAAIPALERVAATEDDLVKAEAAYALVRLGVGEQREALRSCLDYPVNASTAPMVAAGYLARLGDPEGYPVIVKAFEEDNIILNMVACKQLYFFAPFHGEPGPDGEPIDVVALFDRALHDRQSDVQWAALVQLRELKMQEAQSILESYVEGTDNEQLRNVARDILDNTPK